METIYETYSRTVCINCKNKEICQEELRIKTDGSIKCDKYNKKEVNATKKKTQYTTANKSRKDWCKMLTIAILIILSPVILIAGLFSLFIILGIVYTILTVPINLARQVRKCQKQGDQKNIQK